MKKPHLEPYLFALRLSKVPFTARENRMNNLILLRCTYFLGSSYNLAKLDWYSDKLDSIENQEITSDLQLFISLFCIIIQPSGVNLFTHHMASKLCVILHYHSFYLNRMKIPKNKFPSISQISFHHHRIKWEKFVLYWGRKV